MQTLLKALEPGAVRWRHMINHEDRFSSLLTELSGRPFLHQLAFGLCLFERSLPGYFVFQQETGWLGGGDLRAVLARCWSVVEGDANTEKWRHLANVQDYERWMPDSEDFVSRYTSAAIDTAHIACCLLEYLETRDSKCMAEAAVARRDTVYLHIQNSTPGVLDDDAQQPAAFDHPLMVEELSFMSGDLDEIARLSAGGHSFATGLLKRVRAMRYGDLRLRWDTKYSS